MESYLDLSSCPLKECNICREKIPLLIFSSPKCGHEACILCWYNIIKAKSSDLDTIHCPFCRKNITKWVSREFWAFS